MTESQQRQALLAYQQAIHNAFGEVSDGLIGYEQLREVRLRQEVSVKDLQESVRLSLPGLSIMDVCSLSVIQAERFFATLKLTEFQEKIAREVIKEIRSRLSFLHNVGLGYLTLDRESGTLSGGESRMVACGRALMQDPRVLLLDEPTAGLSPLYVDMFFDKIKEIHETRGVAIVLAEQNATKTLQVADRVLVLSLGEAFAVMDAAELTTQQLKEGYRI